MMNVLTIRLQLDGITYYRHVFRFVELLIFRFSQKKFDTCIFCTIISFSDILAESGQRTAFSHHPPEPHFDYKLIACLIYDLLVHKSRKKIVSVYPFKTCNHSHPTDTTNLQPKRPNSSKIAKIMLK